MLPSCLAMSYTTAFTTFNEMKSDGDDVPVSRKIELSDEVTNKLDGELIKDGYTRGRDGYHVFSSIYHLYTLCLLRNNRIYHYPMP